jgi:hypothetical protein
VLGRAFCGFFKQVLRVTALDLFDVKECVNKFSKDLLFEVLEMSMKIFRMVGQSTVLWVFRMIVLL